MAIIEHTTASHPGISGIRAGKDAMPSEVSKLRELSYTLFRMTRHSDAESLKGFLKFLVSLHDMSQDLDEAWNTLTQWMIDLGIDEEDLTYTHQQDAYQTARPSASLAVESAQVLERSAARFAESASPFELLEAEISKLSARILARMDQWKARYSIESKEQRREVFTKLRLLEREKQIALEKSNTAHLHDLVDALKLLFNRILEIEHASFLNVQDRSYYSVDLYKYPPDRTRPRRRKKRMRSEVGTAEEWIKNNIRGNVLEGMIEVLGEHAYYLLLPNNVGLFARELRGVLFDDYDGKVDDMAIDLGVTEKQMFDLLNGWIQGEERIAQRMGVFLYKGRDRLVEAFCAQRLGWKSIEDVPEGVQGLIRMARQRYIHVYGSYGFPGQIETIDGWQSVHLQDSPLKRLLADGTINYSGKPSYEFWNDVRQMLFGIDVNKDGDWIRSRVPNRAENLIQSAIAWKEGWKPLKDIPKQMQGLVEKARLRFIRVFGGRFPTTIDMVDGRRIYLKLSPLNELLKNGTIKYSSPKPPHKYWKEVQQILFGIAGQNEDGKWVWEDEPEDIEDEMRSAIEWKQGWIPIKKIPEDRRALIKVARQKVIDVFGGKLPPSGFETTDGWQSHELNGSPLYEFLRSGTIEHSCNKTADEFWREVRTIIFGIDVDEDGKWVRVDEPPLAKALIRPVIEKMQQWTPLDSDSIPEHMRKFVEEVREQTIDVYGGVLPYIIKTASGWRSGQIKDTSPLKDLLIRGRLDYTASKPPDKLWPEIRQIFFGIGVNEDGTFVKVREPNWVKDLIRPVIEKEEGWKPIDEIPQEVREIVRLAREAAIDLFGGHPPTRGVETIDGWRSGYLGESPFYSFLSNGKVRYTTRNIPPVFWKKCSELFFGLKLNKDGKYRRIPIPKRIAKLVACLEEQGMDAWNAATGSNRMVFHPVTVFSSSKREDWDLGSSLNSELFPKFDSVGMNAAIPREYSAISLPLMFGGPNASPFMALPTMGMSIACPV